MTPEERFYRSKAARQNKVRNILVSHLINKLICDYFDVSLEKLTNCTRKRFVVEPRQISMWLHRNYTTYTEEQIGEIFNKDRTSVIASMKVVENLRSTDRSYRMQFVGIDSEIKKIVSELNHAIG